MPTSKDQRNSHESPIPGGGEENSLDDLGPSIRELRKSRDMTLTKLAVAIDRSVGFLSEIERGITKPTVKDVYAIADVFGVPISWFFEREPDDANGENALIVRAGKRRWMENQGIRTEILSPRLGEGVEFMMSTFAPRAETEIISMGKSGRESAIIISGKLEMWIDGTRYLLEKGDSYCVELAQEFHSRNPSGSEPVVLIWTVTYT